MCLPVVLGALFIMSQAGAQPPATPVNQSAPVIDDQTCLSCHSDAGLSLIAHDGTALSLHIAQDALAKSVHAKIACADCHTGMAEIPHAERSFASRREVTLVLDAQCRRCHFSNYTKTLDSVHQQAVARGDRTAPVCVDCHGSHDVKKPSTPRALVSQTCARCHEGIATAYTRSVHGRALTQGNADVPVCTDCHHTHDVAGPRQTAWELRTPEMCGSCHANPTLMKKYGLSTNVLGTYLTDFHGKTASLRRTQGTSATGPVVARCTDCHGVHDIQKARDPQSPVIKANLLKTCRQCHADATANFPDAWLSHYEPSLHKAPFVYAVKVGYAVIIPFMIGGLGLQILLHLWRLMANR
jgi:nitrate/TMAO reductase-like tetraheme cytochrome c subunit